MLILKSNTNEVFDTSNLLSIKRYKGVKPDVSKALHQNHNITDYDFLKQYFPLSHKIFEDFRESFYYVIE